MERVKRLKEKMESEKLVKGFFLTMADALKSNLDEIKDF